MQTAYEETGKILCETGITGGSETLKVTPFVGILLGAISPLESDACPQRSVSYQGEQSVLFATLRRQDRGHFLRSRSISAVGKGTYKFEAVFRASRGHTKLRLL